MVITDQIEGFQDLFENKELIYLCLRNPNISEKFIEYFMEEIFTNAKKCFKLIEKKGEEKTTELLDLLKILRILTYQNPDLIEENFCDFEGFLK